MSKVQSADDQSQRVAEKSKDIEREEQMRKEVGKTVILALSQGELEKCIAGMTEVKEFFIKNAGTPQTREKAKRLFDTAIASMEMVWLMLQEEEKKQ